MPDSISNWATRVETGLSQGKRAGDIVLAQVQRQFPQLLALQRQEVEGLELQLPQRFSILRDHRTAEAVIDARRDQIDVLVYPFGAQHLADEVANSNGGHIRCTHEQVIVLDGK